MKVYWNAPAREDDVEGQIALLEKVVARGYAGVIISPDQTLPLRTPVRRLVSHGVPIVVVGTNLGVAPNAKLSYVLNDDTVGGQIAARRVGKILNGQGTIAIVGINPQLTGITARERSFENTLEQEYPDIRVVARRLGYYSVPQEQQVAEDVLNHGEALNASGNTRPLEPTKVSCPSASLQSRNACGGNASIAAFRYGVASR